MHSRRRSPVRSRSSLWHYAPWLGVVAVVLIALPLLAVYPLRMVYTAASVKAISRDVLTYASQASASSPLTTRPFSTHAADEVLVAAVSTDGPETGEQGITSVSGGGLTWHRAVRARYRPGDSEIWWAVASAALNHVTVNARRAADGYTGMITVLALKNVDTADPIGATANGGARQGAPSATLTATAAGSLVLGAGNDWDSAADRTLAAGQMRIAQFLSRSGDTYWVQQATNLSNAAGATKIVADTAPTGDQWNLAAVELRPADPGSTVASGATSAPGSTAASAAPPTTTATPIPTVAPVVSATPIVSPTSAVPSSSQPTSSSSPAESLPAGVTLQKIDGGPGYFASLSPRSAWMDQHILLGGWLEQPLNGTEVGYDASMSDNIYWNLAASPADTSCGEPCRADYNVIRAGGMHASAPDVTSNSGSETVAYDGTDESDMNFGPGWNGYSNPSDNVWNTDACTPANSRCGFTATRLFYNGDRTGVSSTTAAPSYPTNAAVAVHQGFGKGVLFWESDADAATFLKYSDILSADSYWMTDDDLEVPSQGGCALLPSSSTACGGGSGSGLTHTQSHLPANYAYNVSALEQEQALNGGSKPVVVDIETGCPFGNSKNCITPSAMTAAAWHSLIAGARGIVWFQHNFGGPCVDFRSFYDGSNPQSGMYSCQQTPGVSLHDMVMAVTAFNTEVTSLNSVLLAPFAKGYVTATGDISYMAKQSDGRFYVFAGSGTPATPPPANQSATFTIAGGYTGPVTVLNENRTIYATNGVFTDKFADANAVHIYEIG